MKKGREREFVHNQPGKTYLERCKRRGWWGISSAERERDEDNAMRRRQNIHKGSIDDEQERRDAADGESMLKREHSEIRKN